MIIQPFNRAHLQALSVQPMQEHLLPLLKEESMLSLYENGDCFSAFIDGRIVGCGGFVKMWEGRSHVWALLARDIGGKAMLQIHGAVKRSLELRTEHRIEAVCDPNFENAHRWLRALGFKWEGTMERWTREGTDCDLYAKVRK